MDRLEGSSIGPPGAPPFLPENVTPPSWGGVRPLLPVFIISLSGILREGYPAPGTGSKIEMKKGEKIPIVGPGILPQGTLVPQRKEGKDENPE